MMVLLHGFDGFVIVGGRNIKKRRKVKGGREIRARVNDQIRCKDVRVIGADGEQVGVMVTADALEEADSLGLDLVEVSASAKPPVCRIMDYGKYRYEESKKQAEARRKQTTVEVKEIKLRPKTEKHDLDFKIRNIRKFLGQKNKVNGDFAFPGSRNRLCQYPGQGYP